MLCVWFASVRSTFLCVSSHLRHHCSLVMLPVGPVSSPASSSVLHAVVSLLWLRAYLSLLIALFLLGVPLCCRVVVLVVPVLGSWLSALIFGSWLVSSDKLVPLPCSCACVLVSFGMSRSLFLWRPTCMVLCGSSVVPLPSGVSPDSVCIVVLFGLGPDRTCPALSR